MGDFETQILGCQCSYCPEACPCTNKYGKTYEDGKINLSLIDGKSMVPIFECNTRCKCPSDCQNRVIQNGITTKLEVFHSERKGLGLRTLENIDHGMFVCEYAGEIISFDEAKLRTKRQTEHDMNYIIVVREHHGKGVMATHVDPTYRGNIGRYLNHSCCPNLAMVPVRVNTMVPKLCLFANRDIPSQTELNFDYGHSSSLSNTGNVELPDSTKPCHCGAYSCKGYLPYEPLLYQ